MDPQSTSDNKPYAPFRYKEIVQECYVISKNLNTSYTDLMKVTPTERGYMLEFLNEEYDRTQRELQKIKDAQEESRPKGR